MENMIRITCECCDEIFEGPETETMDEFEEHDCEDYIAARNVVIKAAFVPTKYSRTKKA